MNDGMEDVTFHYTINFGISFTVEASDGDEAMERATECFEEFFEMPSKMFWCEIADVN